MAVMPVLDTDGISGLLALFVAWRDAPALEPAATDLVGIEERLFDNLAPEPGWGSELRRRLLAAARRMGVLVRRHPDRSEELIARAAVFYRGVSTGDPDLEEVSLAIALAKWLLFDHEIEGTEASTVGLAMRLWRRAGGHGVGAGGARGDEP